MFIIPLQELDEIANDHFGNGDGQIQSTNDEAELQEQPLHCKAKKTDLNGDIL